MERTSHHTQVATLAAFAVYYDYTSEFPHDTLILKIFFTGYNNPCDKTL